MITLLLSLACSGPRQDVPSHPSSARTEHVEPAPTTSVADVPPLPPSIYPAPARLVAIGDVHGDLDAFQSALRAGSAIDADGHWNGGALFVVQTGDLLDRGDQEREILDFVDVLQGEALAAGGRVLALNGNHELMNAQGDFRYVTPGGYHDFDSLRSDAHGSLYEGLPPNVLGRVVAFHPGGPYARMLATHPTLVVVGDTVLVHGGALARYLAADAIDTINRDARAFLLGRAPLSGALESPEGPVWYRGFAQPDDPEMCARLDDALAAAHAHRMVVGHTVQDAGITSGCDGHVFRIDVGLARVYGGPIQVLEITASGTRVISGTR